jgi:DNA-directed RNA polymerase I subunit RPA1
LIFSFYTDEDVRSRSICEVTSHQALDGLGNPLPNGLYDPRMGPSQATAPPCPTCACRYLTCPGHFGHIELCVPIYHPLLFDKILNMLRIKCWHCHKLKAPARVLQVFKAKFLLLQCGEYSKTKELDDLLASTMKAKKDEGGKSSIRAAADALDEALREAMESVRTKAGKHKLPPSTFEQALHRELVSELMSTCKLARSCPNCGAHSPKIRQDSSNKFFQSPLSDTAKRINEAEGITVDAALGNKDNAQIEASESDGSDESDEEDAKEEGTSSSQNVGRDKYMHPAEVQAQVKRTWETQPEICDAVFAVQGSDVFFLQAVPVPPNRFRPPMHLGGMIVEHAQNFYLNKMIQSNESVRDNFATANEAVAYKHWIDLQTHVNCFMDSSKDPAINQNTPIGIRQLLERKEGIFRKHMMGKRVDYACRSVISPDPYVGTNEIGIPLHFAVTLTYPTPVTDINIQEMRTLVERGPDNYPGARWIEFPDRRVDLSKMDKHMREAAAARLLSHAKQGGKPAIVGRQLRDGDMVLMNRQVRSDT